jgi:hypothetical protein
MALTKCRECGAQVSTNAKACPQCGAAQSSKLPRGCAGFLVLCTLVVFYALFQGGNSNNQPDTHPSCKTDWTKCADNAELVNNYSRWFHAQFECRREAIQQALYGTPVWPSSLHFFSNYIPGNRYITTGTATLIEPDAQFQNGFGAMVHSTVTCTYDLRAEHVVRVDILAH